MTDEIPPETQFMINVACNHRLYDMPHIRVDMLGSASRLPHHHALLRDMVIGDSAWALTHDTTSIRSGLQIAEHIALEKEAAALTTTGGELPGPRRKA